VRDVLTQCQRIVNLHTADVVTITTSFTPAAGRVLYRRTEIASDVARVLAVRQEDRELWEVPWRSLVHADAAWYRAVGPRHELFSRIGTSLLAIYPARENPVALSVSYISVPTDLTDGAADVTISDEWIPLLLDLGELVLTAKNREFPRMADVMHRLQTAMGLSTNRTTETTLEGLNRITKDQNLLAVADALARAAKDK
jgi:hypothetical protein